MDKEKQARLAELEQFLQAYPDTAYVDGIFIDLCGIVRGKRYPRNQLEKLFTSGLQIPITVYLLDVVGHNSDPCGRGFSDGDPDGTAVPLPGTLVPTPWSEQEGAQVLMTLNNPDGSPSMIEPRNVAAGVVERFAATGLRPVMAFELEFYLLDRERDASGHPQPARLSTTGARQQWTQVYGIEELDGHAEFFDDVTAFCKLQDIPASVATAEFAPGQYEINLHHIDSPLQAADHCALLRNVVRRTARKHGMDATFMSKPFLDLTGNGMHVHLSLLDTGGNNIFDDGSESGSGKLKHVIGGMLETWPDAMALFAPHVNAFRRFGPNKFVPVSRSWAVNNRSVACRIPVGDGAARRVEHRIAGADANPYLVLAAVLIGVQHGLTRQLDPGAPSDGNACAEVDADMPLNWRDALGRFRQSTLMRSYLGDEYVELYYHTKLGEMNQFEQYISPRELDWYL
ncbi:MAG: glutamine synthetase family protein [Gammaproteobacteria bacterium]